MQSRAVGERTCAWKVLTLFTFNIKSVLLFEIPIYYEQ